MIRLPVTRAFACVWLCVIVFAYSVDVICRRDCRLPIARERSLHPRACCVECADRNNNELLKNLGNFVNRALKFGFDRFDKKLPGLGSAPTEQETNLTEAVLWLWLL